MRRRGICGLGPRDIGGRVTEPLSGPAEAYAALVLGTRDYVRKNGFGDVLIGLSGGIDSTLVALLAVDALGVDRVRCATMPSRYTSEGTRGDAHELAARLGIELLELPIEGPFKAYEEALAPNFAGRAPDLGALEFGQPAPHYGPEQWPVGAATSRARSFTGPPR